MGFARRVAALVAVVSAVYVLTGPALAQSTNGAAIGNLHLKLALLAIPITAAVELILIYTVYRYRNNDDPQPRRENRRLEITWTVATAAILVFVGAASMVVLANPYVSPRAGAPSTAGSGQPGKVPVPSGSNATVVNVTGYQWAWQFDYAGTNVTTTDKLVLPANRSVYLYVSSADVIHSFYSPALSFKQDAFPGKVNTIRTKVTKPGTYQAYCAEFCGAGHSRMRAKIVVLPPDQYRQWLAAHENGTANASATGARNASGNTTSNASTAAAVAPVGPPTPTDAGHPPEATVQP